MKTSDTRDFRDIYPFAALAKCAQHLYQPSDDFDHIYEEGFLPYSTKKEPLNLFFQARSARVYLPEFEPASENRRILRKFQDTFTHESISKPTEEHVKQYQDLFLSYFKKRHGDSTMPEWRYQSFFKRNYPISLEIYKKNGIPTAMILLLEGEKMSHFWFSAYNLDYVHQSLGMWLMVDIALKRKAEGKEYLYLGTVYGDKALYKTNFPSLEWWDETNWETDTKKLKKIAREDIVH